MTTTRTRQSDADPKSLMHSAVAHLNAKRFELAEPLLAAVVEARPQHVRARLLLANTLWELGNLADAAAHFCHATVLAPEHEFASLGLFHVLWKDSRREDALDEARRFLTEQPDNVSEYRVLLAGMYKELGLDAKKQRSGKAKRKGAR